LAAEDQAEAITAAGQASSFTMSPNHLEEDTGLAPDSGSSRGPDIAAAVTVPPAPVVDDDDEDELRPSKKTRCRPPNAVAKHFFIDSNRMTCKSCRATMSKSSRYASHFQRCPKFRTQFREGHKALYSTATPSAARFVTVSATRGFWMNMSSDMKEKLNLKYGEAVFASGGKFGYLTDAPEWDAFFSLLIGDVWRPP
jgi:hypothetical protein